MRKRCKKTEQFRTTTSF